MMTFAIESLLKNKCDYPFLKVILLTYPKVDLPEYLCVQANTAGQNGRNVNGNPLCVDEDFPCVDRMFPRVDDKSLCIDGRSPRLDGKLLCDDGKPRSVDDKLLCSDRKSLYDDGNALCVEGNTPRVDDGFYGISVRYNIDDERDFFNKQVN